MNVTFLICLRNIFTPSSYKRPSGSAGRGGAPADAIRIAPFQTRLLRRVRRRLVLGAGGIEVPPDQETAGVDPNPAGTQVILFFTAIGSSSGKMPKVSRERFPSLKTHQPSSRTRFTRISWRRFSCES